MPEPSREKLGSFFVDGGCILAGDPCQFIHDGGETPHGRVPAWCWVALAVVWVGIAAACVDLQFRMNALDRDIKRLEERRLAEAKAFDDVVGRYQARKVRP